MKFVSRVNHESILDHSDLKFLERLVFIPHGPNAGFMTLKDLFAVVGMSAFASWYVLGHTSYGFNHWNGQFEEITREPIQIYDAKSSNAVDPVGALRVYRRYRKDDLWYRGWVDNGSKPSGHKRYRSLQTMNAIRKSSWVCAEEGEPTFAAKVKSLPISRDGYHRSCNKDRSWKNYRKVQYKNGA